MSLLGLLKMQEEAMKARTFKEQSSADIAPAVLAIGRPSFPQALIGTLRRVADVGPSATNLRGPNP
jgi:hypothetical protein